MIGTSLSHFKITAKLGEGGMGEVYRATDTKLDREVAIKVLPDAFTEDKERLARFEREARLLAQLQHPNIASIYGLEDSGGSHALVMELVEGPTLAERLEQGALPLSESLSIARQIAEALEEAHEKGIIHRDLKPQNIKASIEGKTKVLDFGLAKAMDPAQGGASGSTSQLAESPTLTLGATIQGMILGTAAYMAPEQAKGFTVDKRADIWAFGVVLYEMLTGARMFAADTLPETLAGVLKNEIDFAHLPAATPSAIRRLLRRCLNRDPKQRLHDIADARLVIAEVLAGTSDETSPALMAAAATKRFPAWVVPAALTGLAGLLAVGSFIAGRISNPDGARSTPRPSYKLDLELESLAVVGPGNALQISPDGRQLLYSTADGLRVRSLTAYDGVTLPATDGAKYAFWSPDGRSVAFARGRRLWRMPAGGGPATDLGPLPEGLEGSAGGAWNSADQVVLAGSLPEGLAGYSATGGSLGVLLPVAEGEVDFHEVSPLPDNRGFVFSIHGLDGIDTIAALIDGKRKVLLRLQGETLGYPSYSSTGHLLYERKTASPGLWAVRFSLESAEVVGSPFPVIPNASMPSRADNGNLVFVRSDPKPAELVKVGRDGLVQLLAELSAPVPVTWRGQLGLSPDGRRVALPLDALPYADLWVIDLERGSQTRLDEGWVAPVRPVWMPDSSRLIYGSQRDSATTWKAWIGSADGTAEPKKFELGDENVLFPVAVAPDGKWLVCSCSPEGYEIHAIRFDDPTEKRLIARETPQVSDPATADFSPAGDWLVYQSSEAGESSVWVQPFPLDGRRWLVSNGEGIHPRWSPSGREIFYRSGARMMVVRFEAGAVPAISRPTELFTLAASSGLSEQFEPTHDGQGFLMLRSRGRQRVTVVMDLPALIAEAEEAQRSPS